MKSAVVRELMVPISVGSVPRKLAPFKSKLYGVPPEQTSPSQLGLAHGAVPPRQRAFFVQLAPPSASYMAVRACSVMVPAGRRWRSGCQGGKKVQQGAGAGHCRHSCRDA